MNDLNKAKWNITGIHIKRSHYDKNKPFKAEITLGNDWNATLTINVDEERTLAIIDSVSDIILDQLGIELTNMRETAVALVEEKKLKELPAPIEGSTSDGI